MKERQKARTYKMGQRVVVDEAGAPGLALYGKIAGSPTLMENGLAWPVELEKGLWTEGRKVYIRVLLVHETGMEASI